MQILPPILLLMCVASWTATAGAQAPAQRGNAQAGQQLASHQCDECHIVAAHQDLPPIPGYAPSFFNIANKPTTSVPAVQAFLSNPGQMSKMPHPQLTPAQINDVTAYIYTLRGRR